MKMMMKGVFNNLEKFRTNGEYKGKIIQESVCNDRVIMGQRGE